MLLNRLWYFFSFPEIIVAVLAYVIITKTNLLKPHIIITFLKNTNEIFLKLISKLRNVLEILEKGHSFYQQF